MKKWKTRAGETLIEVVTAMTIFGIVSAGIFDFIANQTLALARAKDRENMMYYAQRYVISGDYSSYNVDEWGTDFTFSNNTLTVTKGTASMTFRFQ